MVSRWITGYLVSKLKAFVGELALTRRRVQVKLHIDPDEFTLTRSAAEPPRASCDSQYRRDIQGYLAHQKQPPSLGPPYSPRHTLTVGSQGGYVSYEKGTPVGGFLWMRQRRLGLFQAETPFVAVRP